MFCYSAGSLTHPTWIKNSLMISPSEWRRQFIRISTVVNALFVVFVPILAVVVITIMLIKKLHLNDMIVLNRMDSSARRSVNRLQVRFFGLVNCCLDSN